MHDRLMFAGENRRRVGDYLEYPRSFANARFLASALRPETENCFRIVKEPRSNARPRMSYDRQIINDVISNAVFMADFLWPNETPTLHKKRGRVGHRAPAFTMIYYDRGRPVTGDVA